MNVFALLIPTLGRATASQLAAPEVKFGMEAVVIAKQTIIGMVLSVCFALMGRHGIAEQELVDALKDMLGMLITFVRSA